MLPLTLFTTEDKSDGDHQVLLLGGASRGLEPSAKPFDFSEGLLPALSIFTGFICEYAELISGSKRYAYKPKHYNAYTVTDLQQDLKGGAHYGYVYKYMKAKKNLLL